MSGQLISFGLYDQCASVKASQYCWLTINTALSWKNNEKLQFVSKSFQHISKYIQLFRYNISFGICLPDACSESELNLITSTILPQSGIQFAIENCLPNKPSEPLQLSTLIAGTILLTILSLNLLSLFLPNIFTSKFFNPTKNLENFLAVKFRSNECKPLNALKCLLMFITICAHMWLFGIWHTSQAFRFYDMFNNFPLPLIKSFAPYTPDMFFMISGFEMARLFIDTQKEKNRTIFAIKYFLKRWLRFSILIAVTICFYMAIYNEQLRGYFGGPFYPINGFSGSRRSLNCKKWGIYHILLISHLIYPHGNRDACIIEDHSLSTNFFYNLIFIFILLPLIGKGKKLLNIFSFMLIVATNLITLFSAINFAHDWYWDIYDGVVEQTLDHFDTIHSKPWIHSTAFLGGIIMANNFDADENQKLPIVEVTARLIEMHNLHNSCSFHCKQKFSSIIWTVWFVAIALSAHWTELWEMVPIIDRWQYKIIFLTLMKSFSISILFAWLFYCVLKNNITNLIAEISSSSFFKILCKLNHSLLFGNVFVIYFFNSAARTLQYSSWSSSIFMYYIPIILYIYIFSFIFYILFEVPLLKMLDSLVNFIFTMKFLDQSNHLKSS